MLLFVEGSVLEMLGVKGFLNTWEPVRTQAYKCLGQSADSNRCICRYVLGKLKFLALITVFKFIYLIFYNVIYLTWPSV